MPDMHASTMSEPLPATVSSCSAGKIQKHCTCTSMSTSRCKGLSFTYTQCKQTIAASSRSRPVAWFCYKPSDSKIGHAPLPIETQERATNLLMRVRHTQNIHGVQLRIPPVAHSFHLQNNIHKQWQPARFTTCFG